MWSYVKWSQRVQQSLFRSFRVKLSSKTSRIFLDDLTTSNLLDNQMWEELMGRSGSQMAYLLSAVCMVTYLLTLTMIALYTWTHLNLYTWCSTFNLYIFGKDKGNKDFLIWQQTHLYWIKICSRNIDLDIQVTLTLVFED